MKNSGFLALTGVLTVVVMAAPDKDVSTVATQVKLLKSDDARVRRQAAGVLMKMGPRAKTAIPSLIEILRDKDRNVRYCAAMVLSSVGDVRAMPALIAALGDEDYRVRFRAAQGLAKIGPPAAGASGALAVALKDKKDSVRWNAAAALAKIGPGAGRAVGALTEALKDNNIQVRRYSAQALAAIGKPAGKTVDALAAMLKDREISARLSAAEALAKLGEGKRAVDTLAAAMKHDDLYRRRRAAEILEIIGPDAKKAAPALLHALNDADGWLTPKVAAMGAAARALGVSEEKLREEAVRFQNDNWIVRWRAARALGKIDPQIATNQVVPILVQMLRHNQPWVRQMSARTLGAIGKPARAAIPVLQRVLAGDKSEGVWTEAHKALKLIRQTPQKRNAK